MKKYTLFTFALVFSLAVVSPSFALAQEETSSSEEITTSIQNSEEDTERNERIKKARKKYQNTLNTSQQARLLARCKSAQGKIQSASSRLNAVATNHSERYQKVVEKLTDLETKLAQSGTDTSSLQTALANLETQVSDFSSQLELMKVALNDASEMDCEADVEGFKAVLEMTKAQLGELRQSSQDIHAYLKDSIKPTLQTIRSGLGAGPEEVTEQ